MAHFAFFEDITCGACRRWRAVYLAVLGGGTATRRGAGRQFQGRKDCQPRCGDAGGSGHAGRAGCGARQERLDASAGVQRGGKCAGPCRRRRGAPERSCWANPGARRVPAAPWGSGREQPCGSPSFLSAEGAAAGGGMCIGTLRVVRRGVRVGAHLLGSLEKQLARSLAAESARKSRLPAKEGRRRRRRVRAAAREQLWNSHRRTCTLYGTVKRV